MLAERGEEVRALVRDAERARTMLPEGVAPYFGDVTDPESLGRAVEGCELVFHAAGLPEQWRRDSSDFQRVNVEGTANVVAACRNTGVRRLVYTSTIDVFAWTPGRPFDESVIDREPRPTLYERSKQAADRLVVQALEAGLDAVFLHPSAVYGPAPALQAGANDFLARLVQRKIPVLLPGGMPVVFSEDVAVAHIDAADRAPAGARFITSDRYLTLSEIARSVAAIEPRSRVPRAMPIAAARAVAAIGEAIGSITGISPLVARGELIFLESHAVPVADRARQQLDWRVTPWEEGLRVTIEALRSKGLVGT